MQLMILYLLLLLLLLLQIQSSNSSDSYSSSSILNRVHQPTRQTPHLSIYSHSQYNSIILPDPTTSTPSRRRHEMSNITLGIIRKDENLKSFLRTYEKYNNICVGKTNKIIPRWVNNALVWTMECVILICEKLLLKL